MTSEQLLQPQSGHVPHAESALSAPFWEGCRNQELRYQRCADCGQANFPPSEHCRVCLSFRLDWRVSAGPNSTGRERSSLDPGTSLARAAETT